MFSVSGVKVILDTVVAAALQFFGYFCPLVSHLLMQVEDDPLFVTTDRILLNVGVQVVMPPIL